MGSFRRNLDALYARAGTVVMGVLNATPDSFFDGGRWLAEAGVQRVDEIIAEGAAVIDIGGESTRPGAARISPERQIQRIAPVLQYVLNHHNVLVSVDTTSPDVAEYALNAGAHAINDVSCLAEPELASVVAKHSAGLILMHSRGAMCDMPGFSETPEDSYQDVVVEVKREWCRARDAAVARQVDPDDIAFDPGIGFWKNAHHSLSALQRIDEFADLGVPIVVGPSRKSFLNLLGSNPPEKRLGGSIAACLYAAEKGVHVVRAHDVQATRQALEFMTLLKQKSKANEGRRERRMVGAC